MNLEKLKKQISKHEGRVNKMYLDTKGIPTIGVGHNLRDKPLSERAIDVILEDDIEEHLAQLDRAIPWWRDLSESRQLVLADMCFNLGINGLLAFKNTLKAIQEGRYEDAALGMQNSLWYKQVGNRAKTLVHMMAEG